MFLLCFCKSVALFLFKFCSVGGRKIRAFIFLKAPPTSVILCVRLLDEVCANGMFVPYFSNHFWDSFESLF